MAAKRRQRKLTESNFRQIDDIRAAVDYGIDVSMLVENIGRSYAERIKRHQIALSTAEKLRETRNA